MNFGALAAKADFDAHPLGDAREIIIDSSVAPSDSDNTATTTAAAAASALPSASPADDDEVTRAQRLRPFASASVSAAAAAAAVPAPWSVVYRAGPSPVHCVPAAVTSTQLARRLVAAGVDSAFYVVDLSVVRRQLEQWRTLLPRVEPFYAMKCNPNPAIVAFLLENGVQFDCASKGEFDLVRSLGGWGAEELRERVIYANPIKPVAYLQAAQACGITMMTFDSAEELTKIAKTYPGAELVLRFATDDAASACRLSLKFGAGESYAKALIERCRTLNLNLVGLSFHVGSGCADIEAFPRALALARRLADVMEQYGYPLRLLDVGGGFPGVDRAGAPSFAQHAGRICESLDRMFPDRSIRMIGEPGRYMVAACHTLCMRVIGTRMESISTAAGTEKPHMRVYTDDGVYGSFTCMPFDHQEPTPVPLLLSDAFDEEERASRALLAPVATSVFGPTCDSLDKMHTEYPLPPLHEGDWLLYENMGAYTTSSSTKFNGFDCQRQLFYIDRMAADAQ